MFFMQPLKPPMIGGLGGDFKAAGICGLDAGRLREPPPACQGGTKRSGEAWQCGPAMIPISFFQLIDHGRDSLAVAAGPHKQGLWVNAGSAWRSEPNGHALPAGTGTAVMARRKARQGA
jgi:hypothetical protein